MIQFNLLPDVKLEYVRVQRTKHTVIMASLIAAGTAFVIFLLMFLAVNVVQRKNISDLNNDVKKYSTELKNTPDLDKVLTIQNQLGALSGLHAGKPAAGRTFTFLQQITPSGISLTDVMADYTANTISITGQAPSLDLVNTLVDTMKYTGYTEKDSGSRKAFSGVVLAQFTRTASGTTFNVTASFAPAIFDNANNVVTLSIPSGISTPSVVGQPSNIFQKNVNPGASGTQGL